MSVANVDPLGNHGVGQMRRVAATDGLEHRFGWFRLLPSLRNPRHKRASASTELPDELPDFELSEAVDHLCNAARIVSEQARAAADAAAQRGDAVDAMLSEFRNLRVRQEVA